MDKWEAKYRALRVVFLYMRQKQRREERERGKEIQRVWEILRKFIPNKK
jgi:hypothetical protein